MGLLVDLFSVFGALLALRKGGIAERLAGTVVIVDVTVARIGLWLGPEYQSLIHLCNDGLAAAALMVITIRYGAPWMGGIMLFFATQFSLHSYYLVSGRPDHDYLHAMVNNIDWLGIICCLIIGTAVAWRRRVVARAPSVEALASGREGHEAHA